jgi:hypothetical protein
VRSLGQRLYTAPPARARRLRPVRGVTRRRGAHRRRGKSARRKGRLARAKAAQEARRLEHVRMLLDKAFERQARRRGRAVDPDREAMAADPMLHPSRRPAARPERAPPDAGGAAPLFLAREDCDGQVEDFVKSLPELIAAKVARTLAKIRVEGVENRAAYAMGVVKRRLRRKARQSLEAEGAQAGPGATPQPSSRELRAAQQRGGEALFYS